MLNNEFIYRDGYLAEDWINEERQSFHPVEIITKEEFFKRYAK